MADLVVMEQELGMEVMNKFKEGVKQLKEGENVDDVTDLFEDLVKAAEELPAAARSGASYAELLLAYGKALLATIRERDDGAGLLGPMAEKQANLADGNEGTDDADEDEDEDEEQAGDEGVAPASDDRASTSQTQGESRDDAPDEPAGAEGAENNEADSQDLFELAWEQLECARVIFEALKERRDDRLADVLETLGDFGMENDNFEQAASDYQAAIDLRVKAGDPDSRYVGGLYHSRYLALRRVDPLAAREALRKAIALFERRIKLAQKEGRQKDVDDEAGLRDEMAEEVRAFSAAIDKVEIAGSSSTTTIGFQSASSTAEPPSVTVRPRKKAKVSSGADSATGPDKTNGAGSKTE